MPIEGEAVLVEAQAATTAAATRRRKAATAAAHATQDAALHIRRAAVIEARVCGVAQVLTATPQHEQRLREARVERCDDLGRVLLRIGADIVRIGDSVDLSPV